MEIKILDSQVISQIAAGEVIERPASVVKELLENAIDAAANRIAVEIRGGGIELIRVTDDGTGISSAQAEMAFQRHATSKIGVVQDLQKIGTLGFRGEALPSIAAVSEIQFFTSAGDEKMGISLNLEGGTVVRREFLARSPGTTVSVQHLFRKVPARLKFLKTAATEGGRIADILTRYALAYPRIKFTLVVDGKTTLRTPGSGKLRDVILAIYGVETAGMMLEVKSHPENWNDGHPQINVSGMIGAPSITRSGRDHLNFFVNGRWVNNRLLGFAVEEAYHGLLMQGKHPIAIINLTLPPQDIDINVHPAKTEIKFQYERVVFGAVQKAVRQTLIHTSPVARMAETKPVFNLPATPLRSHMPLLQQSVGKEQTSPWTQPGHTPLLSLPLLRVLGQLSRNYIVAEGPDGLYLIDQHAAHERIIFERIMEQKESRTVEVQGLLEPVTLEVDLHQDEAIHTYQDGLSRTGFTLEQFGERAYLIRSIPSILKDRDWKAVLREILDTPSGDWEEKLMITLSCHGAVRAGQLLNEIEMQELIKQLEKTSLPHSCPHGRPAIIQIPLQQLEKDFKRS